MEPEFWAAMLAAEVDPHQLHSAGKGPVYPDKFATAKMVAEYPRKLFCVILIFELVPEAFVNRMP